MRTKLLALCAAAITGVFVFTLLTGRTSAGTQGIAVNSADAVPVIVATNFIPSGTTLSTDNLETRDLPRELLAPGAVTDIKSLLGRTAVVPLYRGEAILKQRVSGASAPGSALVGPGRTVFALPAASAHAVGGIVRAGDRISIIGRLGTQPSAAASVLMTDVVVLGVAGEPPFGGPSQPAGGAAPINTAQAGAQSQKILLLDVTLDQAVQLAGVIENNQAYVALMGSPTDAGLSVGANTEP